MNLGAEPGDRFFEAQLQVEPDIFTALSPRASPAAAKQVAEAKEIAQDVAEIGKCIGIESSGRTLQPGMTEAIVARALLRIAQDAVGFRRLFEFFFRARIVGVPIGMILKRQPPIRAFALRLAGLPAYLEAFVLISLGPGIPLRVDRDLHHRVPEELPFEIITPPELA